MLEEKAGISSPDVNINSKLADLKSTKGAGNIVKYAHKAIKRQKADMILFEFEKETKEVFTELEVLKSEKIDVLYYFKDTKVVYKP